VAVAKPELRQSFQKKIAKCYSQAMFKGLYETHLNVVNLESSVDFYQNTLELELCYFEKNRRAAFFWIGEPKQSMLGLWEKPKAEVIPDHFAFECEPDWVLNESIPYLKKKNLDYRNFLNTEDKSPMVFSWMPAIAIYFNDPDGHSLEFIGILDAKARPELGVVSYEKWSKLAYND